VYEALISGVSHQRPPLPAPSYGDPKKQDAAAIKRWLDFGIAYENAYYLKRTSLWNLADLYDQGIQTWLESTYNISPDIAPYWAYMAFKPNEERIPTPVLNEFSGPIRNETARIAKPRYKPHVRTTGEDPGIKEREGAELGEKVLRHELVRMRWEDEYDRGHLHMPLYGGWYVDSFWDESWEDTVRLPVRGPDGKSGALRCPHCGFTLASPKISVDMVLGAKEPLFSDRVPIEGAELLDVMVCLRCPPPPEAAEDTRPGGMEAGAEPSPDVAWRPPALQPFVPVDDDLWAEDAFGRPLGEDWAAGNWQMKTRDPRSIWIENMGIGVMPGDIREWWQVEVVSLDHVRNRYVNGHLVRAESGEAIMRYHPVAGQPWLYFDNAGGPLFSNDVRIRRYCRRPFREWRKIEGHPDGGRLEMNRGRLIETAHGEGGDVVLFDGDLMMESRNNAGTYVARRELDYVAWDLRSGGNEMHGVSQSEGIFDAQDGCNEIWSQLAQCRRAKGQPKWLVERSLNFEYRPGGKAASLVYWDMNPLQPNLAPREIDNGLMNPGVYAELDHRLGYISRYTAMTETERGEPPAGVTAQIAFQYLVDQSTTRRQPRMNRIRAMLQRRYAHGLQLIHEMVEEERVLWDDSDGEWRERTWRALDLVGQTNVVVEIEPDSESALIEQQGVRDFIELKLRMRDMTPRAQRAVARKLRVPEELFDTEDTQTECAAREFVEYMEHGREPVVDPSLDDNVLHDQQHGLDCLRDKWYDLEARGAWDEALKWIADWKTHFRQGSPALYKLMGLELPPAEPDPETGQPGPPPALMNLDQMIGDREGPCLELRILRAWEMLLGVRKPELLQGSPPGMQGVQGVPGASAAGDPQALRRIMRFRAHRESHRIYAEGQKAAAAVGAQVMAAPGGEATPGGTVPTSEQPAAEETMPA
jgi:hypothetical protein